MWPKESREADDADVAAGGAPPPSSDGSLMKRSTSDLEFFDDLVSEPVLVLGMDISHLSRRAQFSVCATGVFSFSLLYGFLQELISVQLCNRQLGLFLAMMQFTGYTLWSYLLRTYVYEKHTSRSARKAKPQVPFFMYLGLSLLRAIDLGMTNMAMQYVNYPAKTLMKSSRVVFTMLFGVMVARKRYRPLDYLVVVLMVTGLVIFMHADANSSAVFDSMGIFMLTISLLCDGAISNLSESIMKQYGVGQDEFIFRMYSIALVAISAAATVKGDLYEGIKFLSQPGTYNELDSVSPEERSWSVGWKIVVMMLFSTMGFFGSSCSAAITKQFGALTMSITSTARKATTLFLSFAFFDNECTVEHVGGILLFISSLLFKSWKRSRVSKNSKEAPMSGASDLGLVEMPVEKSTSQGKSGYASSKPNAYRDGYHVV
jgi:adenosine 3'-phospho 5'-phosphosulfate transporter B3